MNVMKIAAETTEHTSDAVIPAVNQPVVIDQQHSSAATVHIEQPSGIAAGVQALGLDGKLLAAQIINFVILALVLRQFVYKPLMGLLEKRRQTIEQSLTKAEEIEKQSALFSVEHQKRIEASKAEAAAMIDNAKKATDEMRAEIQTQAQADADRILSKAREEIANQKETMLIELKQEVGALVVSATAKILGKELDAKTQSKLIDEAVKEASK